MSHIYENDTKPILSDPPYLLQFILSVVLSVLCGVTISNDFGRQSARLPL